MNFQFIIEYIYQLFLLSPYLFTSVVLVQCVYFSCRNNESHELDLSKSLWGILIITLLTLMEFFIPGIWDLKISHNVITLFLTIDLVLICLVTIFHNSSESKKKLVYLLSIPALLTCLILLNIFALICPTS